MERPSLHPMADPLARINVMAYHAGDVLNWHFDRAEFTTTILLQAPLSGGRFQYRRALRSDSNPNYEGVGRFLAGDYRDASDPGAGARFPQRLQGQAHGAPGDPGRGQSTAHRGRVLLLRVAGRLVQQRGAARLLRPDRRLKRRRRLRQRFAIRLFKVWKSPDTEYFVCASDPETRYRSRRGSQGLERVRASGCLQETRARLVTVTPTRERAARLAMSSRLNILHSVSRSGAESGRAASR